MKKALQVASVASMIDQFTMANIEELQEMGYEVDVAANFEFGSTTSNERIGKFRSSLKEKNISIHNILFNRSVFSYLNIKAYRNLKNIIKENNYEIIHCHSPIGGVITRLAAVKARKQGTKIIYTAHGFHFYKGAPIKNWILYYPVEYICSYLTDDLITINKEDYEIANKKFKAKKTWLINGVGIEIDKYRELSKQDLLYKREENGFKEEDFIVIMVAELNQNKNQIQLIKAMELLKDKVKIKAMIVGKGANLDNLINEVNKRNLKDKIKFMGFREDVDELIAISNLGVLLSYREGLPKSIMEILAIGKNVIGTNIRGIEDIINSNKIGRLVDVGDYKRTAEYIENYYYEFINRKESIVPKEKIEHFDIKNIKKQIKLLI